MNSARCHAPSHGRWIFAILAAFIGLAPCASPPKFRLRSEFPAMIGGYASTILIDQAHGVIYLGGQFSMIGGVPRSNLAALDLATGAVLPWNPSTNFTVFSMSLVGSTLYLGGAFTTTNGQPRNYLAAVNAVTGDLLAWNPNADNTVYALATRNGAIFAGGEFGSMGLGNFNHPQLRFVALNAAGGSLGFAPKPSDYPSGFTVAGDSLYLAGRFGDLDGVPHRAFARISADTGAISNWTPADISGVGVSTIVNGATVYAGGSFSINGQERDIAAFDATDAHLLPFAARADGYVTDLALARGILYLGGEGFTQINGQPRSNLAAVDAKTGALRAWNPVLSGGFGVTGLAVNGTTVFVSGSFDTIAGVDHPGFAAIVDPALDVTPPQLKVRGKKRRATSAGHFTLRGTASDSDGILDRVEVKVGPAKYRRASGGPRWKFVARHLRPGRNLIKIRAINVTDKISRPAKITITRS